MEPVLVLSPIRCVTTETRSTRRKDTEKNGNERGGSGYPARHQEVVRRAWIALAGILAVGGVVTGALTVYAFIYSGPLLPAAISAAIYVLAVVAGAGGVWDITRHVRIIPLYAAGVGETDTFLYGQAIAREFERLETLAEYAGAAPISSFGFPDPLAGETVSWHPAGEGLRSAQALLAAVDTHGYLFDDQEAVRADLQRWETALTRAAEKEIGFSLLLLHGNTTSSLEWERRGGSPF